MEEEEEEGDEEEEGEGRRGREGVKGDRGGGERKGVGRRVLSTSVQRLGSVVIGRTLNAKR